MKTKFALLAAYAIISISHPASGQPGSPDTTFGLNKNGKVTISVINGLISEAYSVAIQADGKIVTAGLSDNGFDNSGPNNFALLRHNQNGILDKTFGNNGKVTTDFGGREAAYAVAIQKDQKIVAAGVTENRLVKHFALARYLPKGAPDSAFGINGKVITDFGTNAEAYAIAFQNDQKIVIAGVSGMEPRSGFAIVRYLHNGTLDKTFGYNGKVTADFGANEAARAVAIQSDGKIVVAGYDGLKGDFVLVRYLQNGAPDRSFGLNGRVATHFNVNELARAYSMAIQKNGKIVLAGYIAKSGFAGWTYDFALARYLHDGKPDLSFGVNGKVTTDVRGDDYGYAVALQSNGKIVVAGYSGNASNWNFALARYRQNGTLDNSFGNGRVITDFGEMNTLGRSVAIQKDGKIVVAGAGSSSGQEYFAIARYNGDNTAFPINSNNDIADLRKADNISSSNIYLYPDPVKDILRIRGLSSLQKTITVIDVGGRALQKITTADNDHAFNVGQLQPGIYYVKINEGDKITRLKFVKE